jgi:outer membrane protein OmpA-like peptidoglycan-associated protein
MYKFKGLDLGVSSKQVIQTFSNFGYTNLDGYGLKRHIIAMAGYKFQLNQDLALRPSVMYKGIPQISQFDFNADVMYKDFIQGGLGYRTNVGIIGRIGINIQDLFFIGYAYEAPMRNIASYSSGSHEVIIGLKLCRKKNSMDMDDVLVVTPKSDTVVRVEYKVDTLVVERVDTVYMDATQNRMVSNQEAERVLDLTAKTLEFENDKALILKKSYGELESLTNIMLLRTDLKIRLEGHTDSNGSDEYNMELSKNRVQSVKDFLVANGVDPSRIELLWYGESNPISDNSTEEGKARNRRVLMNYVLGN